MSLNLSDISLRAVKGQGADRAIVIGGSGSGKSTLADQLGLEWDQRYWHRHGKRLILDRKPRYKAERNMDGTKAKARYKRWDHGAAVPGSVLVEKPDDLRIAWQLGYHVAICQGHSDADLGRMLAVAERFWRDCRASEPQLLHVDEALLFFGPTGQPKGGSDILRTAYIAGRERGMASLLCSQRSKGYPASVLEETNRLYLFRLDYVEDAKRLTEMGAPLHFKRLPGGQLECLEMPEVEHEFVYWTKAQYRKLWGPYKLAV